MADIKITQLGTLPQVEQTDLLAVAKADGSATYKMTISQLAQALLDSIQYADLDTTDKTIIGAINEVRGN